MTDHRDLHAVGDEAPERHQVGCRQVGGRGGVHRAARVGIAVAAVAREVLRGGRHPGLVEPVGEGGGVGGHLGGLFAEGAIPDDVTRRPAVEVCHRRQHPVDAHGGGEPTQLEPGVVGGVGAALTEAARRAEVLPQGTHRRHSAALVVHGHEEVVAEAGAQAGHEGLHLRLAHDVVVARASRPQRPPRRRRRRAGRRAG